MSKSVAESSLSKVNCPGCGAVFGCGSNQNCEDRAHPCWCRDIELSEAALVKLQTLYQGCLCKDCLLFVWQSKRGEFGTEAGTSDSGEVIQ